MQNTSHNPPRLLSHVFMLLMGALFGLFWAYMVSPPVFNNASPNRLNPDAQRQWVSLVAVASSYDVAYPAAGTTDLLNRVEHPAQTIETMLADPNVPPADKIALQQILPLAQSVNGTPAPQSPGMLEETVSLMIPLSVLTAFALVMGYGLRSLNRRDT